jgi:hypothetical protein
MPHDAMPHDAMPQQVPTRTLTLIAKKQPFIATSWVSPVVLLDGYRFPLAWGPNILTIPADRPVHVQCEMPFIFTYGRASAVLQPNHLPELEYSPPATQWFSGEIGAVGTTKTNGTWFVWTMVAVVCALVTLSLTATVLSLALTSS